MEFDEAFIRSKAGTTTPRFDLCTKVPFRTINKGAYDKLVISTRIQVYQQEWVNVDESGLSIPIILLDVNRTKSTQKTISIQYVLSEQPNFEYQLD